MLIGFKVKNFRSFDDLQHFSMVAGKTRNFSNHLVDKKNLKLLKFSSLYGANASGKSNLVLAIDLGKALLFNGIDGIFSNQYFRMNEKNKDIPSYFEYEIEKNNKLYSYGFEININKKEIISEWLIDMTKPKEVKIFERDSIKKDIITDLKLTNKNDFNKFEVCKDDIKTNNKIFFLTEMTRRILMNSSDKSAFSDFLNIFNFFSDELTIILPNQIKEIKFNYFSQHKEDIKPLLQKLGLDISDLIEVDSDMSEIKDKINNQEQYNQLRSDINNIKNNSKKFDITLRIENCIYTISGNNKQEKLDVKMIKLTHINSNTYFDTYEESDGTLRILELIDILLSDNKVYVIDEIDRSLHPSLTTRFIKTFLDIIKEKNVQLIITTHESRLLTYSVLRRDEVWFCDKKDGETKLYSLEQFKDDARFDRKIDKAYLDGRYGAVPIFMDFPTINNENSK